MRNLQREIRKFVRQINPNIKIVFGGEVMESDNLNETVFINADEFLYQYDDEKNHLQVMKEKGFIIDIMLPTYTLLHEIGHVVAFKNYLAKRALLSQYQNQVNGIVKNLKGIERLRAYKNLKLEKDADEWAYIYYLHNYKFVKSFDEKVRAYIA